MSEKTIKIKNEKFEQVPLSSTTLQFISEMHSDIGTCRQVNQDACCVRMMKIGKDSLILAAVCDGVGGLQEGDYASKSTIQALNNWFDYTISRNVRNKKPDQIMAYLHEEIEQCIQKQNQLICEYAQDKGIKTGTTLTVLIIMNQRYITAQIGDSRAYRIGRELCQLTEDQSVVAQEIRACRLSRSEAKHDKRRNIIFQCVGMSEDLRIVYKDGNVEREDVFFLCSDGFVHELEDYEIRELLKPELLVDQSSIKKCLINAVSLVKVRGERDNITVVLIKAYEEG
jgi:serine/threonine protein phosphatase PrpC